MYTWSTFDGNLIFFSQTHLPTNLFGLYYVHLQFVLIYGGSRKPPPPTGVVVDTVSIKHIDTVGEFSLTTGPGRIRRINKQQLPGFPCQKPSILLLYVLEQYPTYSIIVPSCTHTHTHPHRYIHSKEIVIGKYLKCLTLLFSYPTMRFLTQFVYTHTLIIIYIYIVL